MGQTGSNLHPGGRKEASFQVEDRLRSAVYEAGIPLFGVAAPDQPAHFDHFLRWLERGGQAGMSYLSRPDTLEKRRNPKALIEDTQSILVFGFPYPLDLNQSPPETRAYGRIAGYAGSPDYHTILLQRLASLIPVFEQTIGRPLACQIFTDSAPILERDLGSRAGLGWIGKNGNLISPQYGSAFLLAEMFCDAALQPSQPFPADRCGTCRRCMDACPTGCIRSDRTLDAGLCISYLTIENKGAIPRDLRPAVGSSLFGCDICQQVCPWNRERKVVSVLPEMLVDRLPAWLELEQAVRLSPALFKERFGAFPIARAKWVGFLRNAVVVMGNTGRVDYLPSLRWLLEENPQPLVRGHAAWAIGKIGDNLSLEEGIAILQSRLAVETDSEVLEEIRLALPKN